jgi:hypothetical protein
LTAVLHGAGNSNLERTPYIPVRILCFPCDD